MKGLKQIAWGIEHGTNLVLISATVLRLNYRNLGNAMFSKHHAYCTMQKISTYTIIKF
ncbi:MAG: hypothetical protein PHH30_11770 [Bacteroidales bacterium]|nr:hypothetical protein [Bacteroidales bacterium]MDD3861102.1 hypothetical protein [Bacteroidales bacterium]